MKRNYCTGLCLEELCQAATASPDTVTPLICEALEVIPSLSLSSHGLLDLQQQLPLKAVGASLLLPSEVTGELPHQRFCRGCLAYNAAERLGAIHQTCDHRSNARLSAVSVMSGDMHEVCMHALATSAVSNSHIFTHCCCLVRTL